MKPANPSNNIFFTPRSYERRLAEGEPPPRSEGNLALMMLLTKRLEMKPKPGFAVVYTWEGNRARISREKVAPLVREARPIGETSGYW